MRGPLGRCTGCCGRLIADVNADEPAPCVLVHAELHLARLQCEEGVILALQGKKSVRSGRVESGQARPGQVRSGNLDGFKVLTIQIQSNDIKASVRSLQVFKINIEILRQYGPNILGTVPGIWGIAYQSDAPARMELSPSLSNNDVASFAPLSAVELDSQHLGIRVLPVLCGPTSFLRRPKEELYL